MSSLFEAYKIPLPGTLVEVKFTGRLTKFASVNIAAGGASFIKTVEVEAPNGHAYQVDLKWCTEIPEPVPDWQAGDVIRVEGSNVVLTMVRNYDGWHSAWDNIKWSDEYITRSWYEGKVTRLLPEVKK